MSKRTLNEGAGLSYEPRSFSPEEQSDLRTALTTCWGNNGSGWLLGHDLDGLLWGVIKDGSIIISHDIKVTKPPYIYSTPAHKSWGAPLRSSTLQDLRLFNENVEIRIWRASDSLQVCTVSENGERKIHSYDENQILLAGHCLQKSTINGTVFSLIGGPAGQKQALPVDWDGTRQQYRLHARHYLSTDSSTGTLHISDSRLLGLVKQGGN